MSNSTRLSTWSGHLRLYSKDATLSFDGNGTLSLLAGKHRIDCRITSSFLTLRARICGMPIAYAKQQAWLNRILLLNNTNAASRPEFPVLTAERSLQLHCWIGICTAQSEFASIFDGFLDALDAWRRSLAIYAGNRPESTCPTRLEDAGVPFRHVATAQQAKMKGRP